MKEANKIRKLSIDLTLQLNEAENKIADTIIDKMSKSKVSEHQVRPTKKSKVSEQQVSPAKKSKVSEQQVQLAKKTPVVRKKRKITQPNQPEENAPLSDYVKMCNAKKIGTQMCWKYWV